MAALSPKCWGSYFVHSGSREGPTPSLPPLGLTPPLVESLWVSRAHRPPPHLPQSATPAPAGGVGSVQSRGCLHSNSAAGYWPQLLSSAWRTHLPSMDPHLHPKIRLAVGSGVGWVPGPRAFLDLSPRCSSEELLDRLFKKSVVTEAEVTAAGAVCPANRLACVPARPPTPPRPLPPHLPQTQPPLLHSVPQLRDLLGSPGPHKVSQLLSQLSKTSWPGLTTSLSQPAPGQWANPCLPPETSSFLFCSGGFTHPNPPHLQGPEESLCPGSWGLVDWRRAGRKAEGVGEGEADCLT